MHLTMAFGSYMPSHGFWLESFDETFQARIDQQWYGITPSANAVDPYGYDDNGDDTDSSLARAGIGGMAGGMAHGRRHGGHHTPHSRVKHKQAMRHENAHSSWTSGHRRADAAASSSGSLESGSGSGSGSGSEAYECTYDNECSYSNGDGGGYGRKFGWEFAFNLTTTDVFFFQEVLPTLRWVVRVMSWIYLITCALRFFAFVWADLPVIVWRILEEEDIADSDHTDNQIAPQDETLHANVEKDEADVIWIAEQKRKKPHTYVFDDSAEQVAKDRPDLRNRQIWAALTNSEVHYETAFVIFPLIAVIVDEPLYSAYSLLEMCFWDSSRPVTDAVMTNIGKIGQLVVLAFLYLYIQMVLGMFTIKDGFAQEYCSNMFQCLQSMTDVTIRDYGVFDMLGYPEDVYRYPSNIIDAMGIHEEMRAAAVFIIKKPMWDVTFQILFSYVLIAMVCST